uniref:Uncharacterized protein n=1 Tax=Tanacetum cinerariifolium TaxID=118510 RepID=A0A6L2J0H4_TANCI|nr:hypothetical protein [Tanacetum cinerariifolium]
MGTIDNIRSILTQPTLDVLCEKYYIHDVVHPELPGRNDRIQNSPPAAKVSHFEILCRVHGFEPTVGNFRRDGFVCFYTSRGSYQGGDNAAKAGQAKQGDHVVNIRGIDIMADDEIQAIITEQPKRIRKKRKATDGAGGSGLPLKKLREDHGTFDASVGGKSVVVLQSLLEGSTLAAKVGVTEAATVPFVTSSVTPTPERVGNCPANFVTELNLRTQKPAERFVISFDFPHEPNANAADYEVTSVVSSSIPDLAILTTAVATTVIADTLTPVSRVGHGSGAG